MPNWRSPYDGRPDDERLHGVIVQSEQGVVSLVMRGQQGWLRMRRTPGQVCPLEGSEIETPGYVSSKQTLKYKNCNQPGLVIAVKLTGLAVVSDQRKYASGSSGGHWMAHIAHRPW